MITVENLTKRYGGFTAVDDISFEVRPGSVVGFLGPNGAGQVHRHADDDRPHARDLRSVHRPRASPTATCTTPAARSASCSTPPPSTPAAPAARSCASPPSRSACPRPRVDEALALVGLTDEEAGRRVRNYSLGMRQRLGLASPCSASPRCSSSTSPPTASTRRASTGCAACSASFADGGGTVLLSSHLLHEVAAHRRRPRHDRPRPDRRHGHQGRAAQPRRHHRPLHRRRPPRRALERAESPSPDTPRASSSTPSPASSAGRPRRAHRPARAALRRLRGPRGDVPQPHRLHLSRRRPQHDRHRHHTAPAAARPVAGRPTPPAAARACRCPLVHAELRKMVDTRAGRWMLIVMSAASRPSSWPRFSSGARPRRRRSATSLGLTTLPLVMLLPILGIMAATAEWSQRTGLVTFTLEPRRGRVILAKIARRPRPRASWSPRPPPPRRSPTSSVPRGRQRRPGTSPWEGRRFRARVRGSTCCRGWPSVPLPQHPVRDRGLAPPADPVDDRELALVRRSSRPSRWLDLETRSPSRCSSGDDDR